MPLPGLRAGILWGLACGVFVGCLIYWRTNERPWRAFLPDWNGVDSYPILAGIASISVFWNFFIPKSAASTLSLLSMAWDFAPHFNMYAMLRRYGTVIPLATPPADGSGWSSATYPQGIHALMATVAEVVAGPTYAGNDAETLLFLRLVGLVGTISTVLVVASLTSIPSLRHQPKFTLPLAALVAAAWLVGPGAIPVFGGFPNFALGVAVCVAVLSIMRLQRQSNSIRIAVLFSMSVVSVSHNWVLLLALCAPACVIILATEARMFRQQALTIQVVWAAALAVAVAGASLAAWQLRQLQLSPEDVLTTPGGITQPDWGMDLTFVSVCAICFLLLFKNWWLADRPDRRLMIGIMGTTGSAVVGGLMAAGFGIWQIATAHALSYYFYKFGLAAMMLAIAAAAMAGGEILIPRFSQWTSGRRIPTVALAFATIGAVGAFGWPTPILDHLGLASRAPGSAAQAIQARALNSVDGQPNAIAQKLVAISHYDSNHPFIYVGYVNGLDPMLAAQWSLALQGNWTEHIQRGIPYAKALYNGPSQVPQAIQGVLTDVSDLNVLVDARLVPELRSAFPAYADRIVGLPD